MAKKIETLRQIKGNLKVWHDLFRLNIANTKRNLSYHEEESKAIWEPVPHKHFFHTYDSRGRKQSKSTPSAGHFHEVIWREVEVEDDKGNKKKVLKAECGPPMVMSKGKACAYKYDKHVHEVDYIQSEEIEMRQINEDAARMINYLASEERSAQKGVAGVLKDER